MLGHARIDTTQIYARIRPAGLERAVEFYEEKAMDLLAKLSDCLVGQAGCHGR